MIRIRGYGIITRINLLVVKSFFAILQHEKTYHTQRLSRHLFFFRLSRMRDTKEANQKIQSLTIKYK